MLHRQIGVIFQSKALHMQRLSPSWRVCLLFVFFCSVGVLGSAPQNDAEAELARTLDRLKAGDLTLFQHLTSIIRSDPALAKPFLNDPDPFVRRRITSALTNAKHPDAIPFLLFKLQDDEGDIRRSAIIGLTLFPRDVLFQRCTAESIEAIYRQACRWEDRCDDAFKIVGDWGDPAWIPRLREQRDKAAHALILKETSPHPPHNVFYAPAIVQACWMAMVKLGDAEATEQLRLMAFTPEILPRVFAIKCLEYLKREAWTDTLIPLLDDERDALNIAPRPSVFYHRICDLALIALIRIYGIESEISFQVVDFGPVRYSREQIAEVLRIIHSKRPE
ncbi:MAG: HEAT repeat domain-containing protein [Acidobacteria bacterium]|nr:HEAT repeat domain-containing protein [Acidobacteriota bacterium]HNU00531.1 hypothetical protein [Acidobacteriota bacterium]